jgi:hypothetical protein
MFNLKSYLEGIFNIWLKKLLVNNGEYKTDPSVQI